MPTMKAGKRLQHRVSLDKAMGPLYEWLCTLDAPTRAREIVYLIRLGAQVHLGTKSVHLASAGVPISADPGHSVERGATAGAQVSSMASWDFDSMCTPPRKGPTAKA